MIRNSLLYICLLTAALLFLGLHSALACPEPFAVKQSSGVRVDHCHPGPQTSVSGECCESLSCHRTTAPVQDLAYPQYQTRRTPAHPLVHENFSQTPSPRGGEPFLIAQLPSEVSLQPRCKTDHPRQALVGLRSVVLLH